MGWFGENTEDMDPGDVFEDLEAGLHEHDRSARKAPQPSSGKHTILYAVLAVVGVLVGALIFYCVYTGQLPDTASKDNFIQELQIALAAKETEFVQVQEKLNAAAVHISGLEATAEGHAQELQTAPADAVKARVKALEAERDELKTAATVRAQELETARADLDAATKKVEAATALTKKLKGAPADAAKVHKTRVENLEAKLKTAVLRAEKFEAATNKLKAAAPVGTKDLEAAKQELVAKLTAAEEAHATRVKLEAERDLENLKKRAEVLVAKLESVYYPGDNEAEYYRKLHNKATPLASELRNANLTDLEDRLDK
eukprot:110341_1